MSELIIEGLVPELAAKAREHRTRAHALGLDVVFIAGTRTSYDLVPLAGEREALDRQELVDELRRIAGELGLAWSAPARFSLPI